MKGEKNTLWTRTWSIFNVAEKTQKNSILIYASLDFIQNARISNFMQPI